MFEQEYNEIVNEYITLFDTPYQRYLKSRIGMMNDPKVVIVNDNNELFNIQISDLMNERSLVAGEFYQKNGVWKMNFICLGYTNGVEAIYEMYGGK